MPPEMASERGGTERLRGLRTVAGVEPDPDAGRPQTGETVPLTVDERDVRRYRETLEWVARRSEPSGTSASIALNLSIALQELQEYLCTHDRPLTVRFDLADVAVQATALAMRAEVVSSDDGSDPAGLVGLCDRLTDALRAEAPSLAGWTDSHRPAGGRDR